jgi:L-2-hydroxycarboxylate dehydrogenase (NAD+)
MTGETETRIQAAALQEFCQNVLEKLDVPEQDAAIVADVLVAADLRGIASHGVARLRSFYVNWIREGMVVARPDVRVVAETPATAVIDAGAGLGHPASYRAMKLAIEKALDVGAGFVAVRNSNHFGIAGYYAMMALEQDCAGLCMTNTHTLVVPTFGRDAMLGTNPIAVAVPSGRERPFVLDMATSIVPLGKLEVHDRLGQPIPESWATDARGVPTTKPGVVLENFSNLTGGGLLPLGGAGEESGGHKGYGLALWVEIFSALFSGAMYADLVYPRTDEGKVLPSQIGHFFGAWRVDAFRPRDAFGSAMDDLLQRIRASRKAEGQTRVYVAGEKEQDEAERRAREGIPLPPAVAAELQSLSAELRVSLDLESASTDR